MIEVNENVKVLKTADERVTIITQDEQNLCISQIVDGEHMAIHVSLEELAMIVNSMF